MIGRRLYSLVLAVLNSVQYRLGLLREYVSNLVPVPHTFAIGFDPHNIPYLVDESGREIFYPQ